MTLLVSLSIVYFSTFILNMIVVLLKPIKTLLVCDENKVCVPFQIISSYSFITASASLNFSTLFPSLSKF